MNNEYILSRISKQKTPFTTHSSDITVRRHCTYKSRIRFFQAFAVNTGSVSVHQYQDLSSSKILFFLKTRFQFLESRSTPCAGRRHRSTYIAILAAPRVSRTRFRTVCVRKAQRTLTCTKSIRFLGFRT